MNRKMHEVYSELKKLSTFGVSEFGTLVKKLNQLRVGFGRTSRPRF